jgi:hypothetical protein
VTGAPVEAVETTARPGPHAGVADTVERLRNPRTIRERATKFLDRAEAGGSACFRIDRGRLGAAADLVAETTRRRHPALSVPFHSRWRHVEAGGVDRRAALEARLGPGATALERARLHVDLVVASVLLDAGAGPDWRFVEPGTGLVFARSEGLGVASVHAFAAGLFSGDPTGEPLRVDAAGLARLDAGGLGRAFQVGPGNPLVGLDGRAALLRRLGEALAARPDVFGAEARPGGLIDSQPRGGALAVPGLFGALLDALSPIWPSPSALDGVPLGDVWPHPAVGLVPFHKLTQWLTYSLVEPFAWAGVAVEGLDVLTGLPEYRNGGLLLDSGVLALVDPADADRVHAVGSELVVEWRALTVALLDALAPPVRDRLGLDAATLPLAALLEGGTWAAGRELAQRLRNGLPPIAVASDGTVF